MEGDLQVLTRSKFSLNAFIYCERALDHASRGWIRSTWLCLVMNSLQNLLVQLHHCLSFSLGKVGMSHWRDLFHSYFCRLSISKIYCKNYFKVDSLQYYSALRHHSIFQFKSCHIHLFEWHLFVLMLFCWMTLSSFTLFWFNIKHNTWSSNGVERCRSPSIQVKDLSMTSWNPFLLWSRRIGAHSPLIALWRGSVERNILEWWAPRLILQLLSDLWCFSSTSDVNSKWLGWLMYHMEMLRSTESECVCMCLCVAMRVLPVLLVLFEWWDVSRSSNQALTMLPSRPHSSCIHDYRCPAWLLWTSALWCLATPQISQHACASCACKPQKICLCECSVPAKLLKQH